MIFQIGSLFGAIKEAYHYVSSAVKRGVSSKTLSRIITPISDVIDLSQIDEYYGLYEEAVESWQKLLKLSEDVLISEQFAIITPFDWRHSHIMKMRIKGKDRTSDQEIDTWITVESDRQQTKGEWLQQAQEAVFDSPFGYSYEVDYVSEYEYYLKA